jgi:hypothetical protein
MVHIRCWPEPYIYSAYRVLARTIHLWCIYGVFGREIIKHAVIYGVCIRFWPTLHIQEEVWVAVQVCIKHSRAAERSKDAYFCEVHERCT